MGARVITGLLSLVLLTGGGWGWYLGQVADASVNRTDAIPTSGNESAIEDAGESMNLLLVGSDSRASASEEELGELNTEANDGINTDTMILVHVPADGSAASFVSFPRDSYVDIPGYGMDKLNAAYADGYYNAPDGATATDKQEAGQRLLIQTISQLSGLQIDHYAEVDLLGFFNISNVVGGVEVNLCNAVQDDDSGVDLPAGVQTISGSQALSFVRQRHGLPRGDLDRIVRQQTFIAGMIRKVLSNNTLFDLGQQRALVEAAAGSLTLDSGLDLFSLATQLQSIDPNNINFQTIPIVNPDGRDPQDRSIVELADQDTLHAFFAQLSADPDEPAPTATTETGTPTTALPGDVQVSVFNGSGTSGLAASAATALQAAGFLVAGTGNADASTYATTEIRYAAGDDDLAAALLNAVPGATLSPEDDLEAGTVQLVLGSDFNGIGTPVTAPVEAAATGEAARTATDTTCIN